MTQYLSLSLNHCSGVLSLKCDNSGLKYWRDITLASPQYRATEQQLAFKILLSIKSVFADMPFDNIHIDSKNVENSNISLVIAFVQNILINTNQLIKDTLRKNLHAPISTKSASQLFVNIGNEEHFKLLYDSVTAYCNSRIIYFNMDATDKTVSANWYQKNYVSMPTTDLIDMVQRENISKIISPNFYFAEYYLNAENIYLTPILEKLNVANVTLALDHFDHIAHGYAMKALYCDSGGHHFCCNMLHKHWDSRYALKHSHAVAALKPYRQEDELVEFSSNYHLLITQQSYLADVVDDLHNILFLLESMNRDNIFLELKLWFYSLRYLVLDVMPLDEFLKQKINARLTKLYTAATQFLNYDMIANLSSHIEIDLYGDDSWQEIFPQHYKGPISDTKRRHLLSQQKHIYLLANPQTSWLDTDSILYDAIINNIPFLSLPPIAVTPELAGLDNFVYHDSDELKEKIRCFSTYSTQQDTKHAIHFLKDLYNDSFDSVLQCIAYNETSTLDNGAFRQQYNAHDRLFRRRIEHYLEEKESWVRETFWILFTGQQKSNELGLTSSYFTNSVIYKMLKTLSSNKHVNQQGNRSVD